MYFNFSNYLFLVLSRQEAEGRRRVSGVELEPGAFCFLNAYNDEPQDPGHKHLSHNEKLNVIISKVVWASLSDGKLVFRSMSKLNIVIAYF